MAKKIGAAPKSKAERDKFYREGKRPNSVKIGEKYYGYGSKSMVPPAVHAVKAGVKAVGKYMEGRKAKAGKSEFERDDRKAKPRKGR